MTEDVQQDHGDANGDGSNNANKKDLEEDQKVEEHPEVDYHDKYLRLMAEFDNFRKRKKREFEEHSWYIKSQFVEKLLTVLDDFENLLNNNYFEGHSDDSVRKGFELIYNKIIGILEIEGLEKIHSDNMTFDPYLHEALSIEDVKKKNNDGKIISEFQAGYVFKGKLLRPSRVKVGRWVSTKKATKTNKKES